MGDSFVHPISNRCGRDGQLLSVCVDEININQRTVVWRKIPPPVLSVEQGCIREAGDIADTRCDGGIRFDLSEKRAECRAPSFVLGLPPDAHGLRLAIAAREAVSTRLCTPSHTSRTTGASALPRPGASASPRAWVRCPASRSRGMYKGSSVWDGERGFVPVAA